MKGPFETIQTNPSLYSQGKGGPERAGPSLISHSKFPCSYTLYTHFAALPSTPNFGFVSWLFRVLRRQVFLARNFLGVFEIRVEVMVVVVVVGTEKSDWDTGDLNLPHLPPQ